MIGAIVSGDLFGAAVAPRLRPTTEQSDGTYGLGVARYSLSCGTFYGHDGGVNGTASIAVTDETGTIGATIALNLRDGTDPHLPAIADDLICDRIDG